MQSARDMRMKVVGKAIEDADFRARLMSDPKGVIGAELGVTIPDTMTIEVHEEAPETAHLVLPPESRLSEADMRTAGGGSRSDWDPTDTDWSDLRLW